MAFCQYAKLQNLTQNTKFVNFNLNQKKVSDVIKIDFTDAEIQNEKKSTSLNQQHKNYIYETHY